MPIARPAFRAAGVLLSNPRLLSTKFPMVGAISLGRAGGFAILHRKNHLRAIRRVEAEPGGPLPSPTHTRRFRRGDAAL